MRENGGGRPKRPELVWPGKYDEDGSRKEASRASLPFQVIERVNESRATREAKKSAGLSLFDVYEGTEGETFEEGWRNKLVWGDNLLVMNSLLENFAGKIDLIYVDPPYATGADFSFVTKIGDTEVDIAKEQSVIEAKAYRDTWARGLPSYLSMIFSRFSLMKELLSPTGSIYVHLGHHVGHYVKVLLDDVFGVDRFQNEIIWYYKTGGATKERFSRKHDNIFFYTKSPEQWVFNPQKEKSFMMHKYGFKKSDFQIDESTGLQYSMVYARDVFDIPSVGSDTSERVGFPTQKPEALLERIIRASSNKGQLVADFFCGSGTTSSVAEKLGRRWIACDLSRYSVHVTRKRLLEIEGCNPFEILNLGRYERQVWQGAAFGGSRGDRITDRMIYEYLAFVLKLYGAEPISGSQHLHGRRSGAMVHVGPVDAPVTIGEVAQAVEECATLGQKELHVLGWEWEMGLAGPNEDGRGEGTGGLMQRQARERGVKLLLLQIPREVMEEQAADRGDVRFFELAYLEVGLEKPDGPRSMRVALEDFVIPNTDLIPEEVRESVSKWSDYVDYWAVDWDFRNDSFTQGWVAYRTRQDRSLQLVSDSHEYEGPGTYRIAVKVIDVFGNDTTRVVEAEVC